MTRRTSILIAVAVLLIAGWFAFLYLPASGKQAKVRTELRSAEAQLRDYESTLAQVPVFMAARSELRKKLQSVNSSLYAKEDLVELFDELERKAGAFSLRTVEITPPVEELLQLNNSVPSDGEPQVLSLNIVLKGNYIDFGRFVEALENAPYFRTTQSCIITRFQDGSDQVAYSLGFKALLGMTMEGVS